MAMDTGPRAVNRRGKNVRWSLYVSHHYGNPFLDWSGISVEVFPISYGEYPFLKAVDSLCLDALRHGIRALGQSESSVHLVPDEAARQLSTAASTGAASSDEGGSRLATIEDRLRSALEAFEASGHGERAITARAPPHPPPQTARHPTAVSAVAARVVAHPPQRLFVSGGPPTGGEP